MHVLDDAGVPLVLEPATLECLNVTTVVSMTLLDYLSHPTLCYIIPQLMWYYKAGLWPLKPYE
jgi:hypothetical protein